VSFSLTGVLSASGLEIELTPARVHALSTTITEFAALRRSEGLADGRGQLGCLEEGAGIGRSVRDRNSNRGPRNITRHLTPRHAESKSAGPDGQRATSTTVGLLARRHVTPVHVFHLGKETNQLEGVEQGQVRNLADVQEMFESPKRSLWDAVYLPRLKATSIRALTEESGIAESLLHRYKKGTTRPTPRQMKLLVACLRLELSKMGSCQAGADAAQTDK
jgi:hypothetical protein